MYYLLDITPIEEAGFEFGEQLATAHHATLTDVLHIFNKLMDIQGKIETGEIPLKDQHDSYERDKQEFEHLLDEQRREDAALAHPLVQQTPALSYLLKSYGEAVKASKGRHGNGLLGDNHPKIIGKKHPRVL